MQTQREAQQANELSNLTRQRQLLANVNYRRAIIQELERLLGNLVACKTREHLKCIQKAVFVEVIELKKQLCLQVIKKDIENATAYIFVRANTKSSSRVVTCPRDLLKDQLLVYFDLKTQWEVQLATEINNLTRQLLDIIDEMRSFIGELVQRLPTNVMAYKTRQELKFHQKDDIIRAMEMRSTALQLHHQAMKGFHFYKSL
ncbi:hypothetical protein Tco_1490913 [Tanacetum coccineum]